jgi:hypothetical protein
MRLITDDNINKMTTLNFSNNINTLLQSFGDSDTDNTDNKSINKLVQQYKNSLLKKRNNKSYSKDLSTNVKADSGENNVIEKEEDDDDDDDDDEEKVEEGKNVIDFGKNYDHGSLNNEELYKDLDNKPEYALSSDDEEEEKVEEGKNVIDFGINVDHGSLNNEELYKGLDNKPEYALSSDDEEEEKVEEKINVRFKDDNDIIDNQLNEIPSDLKVNDIDNLNIEGLKQQTDDLMNNSINKNIPIVLNTPSSPDNININIIPLEDIDNNLRIDETNDNKDEIKEIKLNV